MKEPQNEFHCFAINSPSDTEIVMVVKDWVMDVFRRLSIKRILSIKYWVGDTYSKINHQNDYLQFIIFYVNPYAFSQPIPRRIATIICLISRDVAHMVIQEVLIKNCSSNWTNVHFMLSKYCRSKLLDERVLTEWRRSWWNDANSKQILNVNSIMR